MQPVCLDVTRLTRRAALRHMTGIDRVEFAYLSHFLDDPDRPFFGLVRTGRRFCLLNREGLNAFVRHAAGQGDWGPKPLWSGLSRRPPTVLAAEACVAQLAAVRTRIGSAADMFQSVLPEGCVYINTGHSNLNADVFGAFTGVPDTRSAVFVHDVIPMDWPRFQRKGQPEVFARRLRNALTFARDIIVPSSHVRRRVATLSSDWSLSPNIHVAALGVPIFAPSAERLPPGASGVYFVAVGTIEPRKNHALLLDLWDSLEGAERPTLFVVGRRGWRNEAVFERLDAGVPGVVELPDLDDQRLAALLDGAAGLLHPSFDEGFGLPPHEAAARGVVPVCAPIPAFKEFLGEAAIYADPADLYQWRNAVSRLAEEKKSGSAPRAAPLEGYTPPSWEAHFKDALTTIC